MDRLEWIMAVLYLMVMAYVSACPTQTTFGMALRQAVKPFQIVARARNAGATRSAQAWRSISISRRAGGLVSG
jgi:hypothetical protein